MAEAGDDGRLGTHASLLSGGPLSQTSSLDQHEASVINFTSSNNLDAYYDSFKKASILAQHDVMPEELPNISLVELNALKAETEHKWRQPWTLYYTIIICSIGAIEQGMAQTSMNGANLYFPAQFGIGSNSRRDSLIVGFINSGIYLSVGFVGAWLSDPVNNQLGRRGAILLGSAICVFGNITSALSQNWQTLLLFRVLLGAGLGINASTINVYVAECAPAYVRGGLAVSWQMFVAFGVFLGFVANVAVFNLASPWRAQLAFPAIPALLLVLLVMLCPESPAWLVKSGHNYGKAFQSLRRLRNTDVQAARDVYAMSLQTLSASTKRQITFIRKFAKLFTVPRIRRATQAAFVVMLAQQLCGINTIAFYSSTIFSDAGFTTFQALLASTVFGFVNFLGAFPAIWTMDGFGRRSLLLITLPFMALTMLAAGLTYSLPETSSARFGLLAAMIYLFCAEYSPGMGPVPNPYCAEVFPLSHREIGMSFAVSVANVWASVLSLTFPWVLTLLRSQGAFILYACLNVLALVLIFFFVPETKMKTLEELDDVFSVRTRDFIQFQSLEYLPWWVRRYVLRQTDAQLEPMDFSVAYSSLDQDDLGG